MQLIVQYHHMKTVSYIQAKAYMTRTKEMGG